MQTPKQEYRQFLFDNFPGLRLRQLLFYSWAVGLRFDLQLGDTNTDEYFKEVSRIATEIFQSAFDNSDTLFVVLMDYKFRRQKIRQNNFLFRQVKHLKPTEIFYTNEKRLYEPNDKFDIRNVAIIKSKADRINYSNILAAIAHSDFPPRQPRLDKNGVLTSKEVYFINADKKLIFQMYDDRGLDIIAADKETLRPIYLKHNDWLLEYDKKDMDITFGQ